MLALSIRQPFAELILLGIKTTELRSRSTNIVGQRFYIYASKAKVKPSIWSADLTVRTPPFWMVELARQVAVIPPDAELVTGMIVGSAVVERVVKPQTKCDLFQWVLTDVRRWRTPHKPARQPQPVWFRPF